MGGRTEVEDDGGGERALDGEAGLGLVLLHLLLGDLGGRDCGEVSSVCPSRKRPLPQRVDWGPGVGLLRTSSEHIGGFSECRRVLCVVFFLEDGAGGSRIRWRFCGGGGLVTDRSFTVKSTLGFPEHRSQLGKKFREISWSG